MTEITDAEKLILKLERKYWLTYSCVINLEGTINNMLQDGISIEKIEYYLDDILENIDFYEGDM